MKHTDLILMITSAILLNSGLARSSSATDGLHPLSSEEMKDILEMMISQEDLDELKTIYQKSLSQPLSAEDLQNLDDIIERGASSLRDRNNPIG